MRLFRKKQTEGRRCSECRYYVMVAGHGYCAKDVPPSINVRLLSPEGIRRRCTPCPAEMTCPSWDAR